MVSTPSVLDIAVGTLNDRAMTGPEIWKESFKVHSYEVDARRQAKLESLCRFFQEAAWNHAESLGVGFTHLGAQNKLWVLSRLIIRLDRYPRWGETVEVQTWPRMAKSAFAMRDFEFFDSASNRQLAGTSAWLVLDEATRKPQRIDKLLNGMRIGSDRRALPEDPDRLPASGQPKEATRRHIAVQWSDLDVNNHVNYGSYIRWVLDAVGPDSRSRSSVRALEVNYLGEAKAGDELEILTWPFGPEAYAHCILTRDQTEICRIRTRWV